MGRQQEPDKKSLFKKFLKEVRFLQSKQDLVVLPFIPEGRVGDALKGDIHTLGHELVLNHGEGDEVCVVYDPGGADMERLMRDAVDLSRKYEMEWVVCWLLERGEAALFRGDGAGSYGVVARFDDLRLDLTHYLDWNQNLSHCFRRTPMELLERIPTYLATNHLATIFDFDVLNTKMFEPHEPYHDPMTKDFQHIGYDVVKAVYDYPNDANYLVRETRYHLVCPSGFQHESFLRDLHNMTDKWVDLSAFIEWDCESHRCTVYDSDGHGRVVAQDGYDDYLVDDAARALLQERLESRGLQDKVDLDGRQDVLVESYDSEHGPFTKIIYISLCRKEIFGQWY